MARSLQSYQEPEDVDERDFSLFVEQEKASDRESGNQVHYSRASIVRKKDEEEPFRIDDEAMDSEMEKRSMPNYTLKVIGRNKTIPVTTAPSQSTNSQTIDNDGKQSHPSAAKQFRVESQGQSSTTTKSRQESLVIKKVQKPKKRLTKSFLRQFGDNRKEKGAGEELTEEQQRQKQIAFSRRRNYTAQFARGSGDFRKQARANILNSAARGICEEGLCRQFAGGQEVPFDYSTFCSDFCPSSPTGTFHPENQDVTMVATAT